MSEPIPQPEQSQPEQGMSPSTYGCLTAFVLGLCFFLTRLLGGFWLLTVEAATTRLLFGSLLTADLVRGLGVGFAMLIPFGLIALVLRDPRFALWRGAALSLAGVGGYSIIAGLLLAAERALPFPGLPDSLRSFVVLLYGLLLIVLNFRFFLSHPPGWRVWWGLGLGLIISIAWAAAGGLGMPSEIFLSMLEALAYGLLSAVLITLLFRFDPEMPARRPFWSVVIAGLLFITITPALLAARGWWLQGNTLSIAFIPVGFMAGLLLTLSERPDPRRLWWAVFAYLVAIFLMPLLFTEGFEGDYMPDDLTRAWAPAPVIEIGVTSVLVLIMLMARPWLARISRVRVVPITAAIAALLALVAAYFLVGRPGAQPETFFVVMADQADTSFAADIEDRDERTAAVYEALTEHAAESQAELRALLDQRGVDYTAYYLVSGFEVKASPMLRAQISGREDVAYVLESPHTRPMPRYVPDNAFAPDLLSPPDILSSGVDAVDAELVWDELEVTGEGIIVGIADTGVAWQHPAIAAKYVGRDGDHNYAWFDPWEGRPEPVDTIGHGTHVTGTVTGDMGIGMAPGAQWIACRNLARNLANPAYYLDCMQFLFAPFPLDGDPHVDGDPARGAHVTNNSWGCPPQEGCDPNTLGVAVAHLRNAGQMFVVSAGNEGPDCDTVWSPANADAGFSIGASDPQTGEIASFSSRGPVMMDGSGRIKPDVVAPGVAIMSSVPGDGYSAFDGTSMAGPHVAGLVALMWSANPALIGDIDATEALIRETARTATVTDPCGGTDIPNNVYGYGVIDARAAVQAAIDNQP